MDKDNAMNALVDLFVKEYIEMKEELEKERKLTTSLGDQNRSLYLSRDNDIKKRTRVRDLLAPKVTWSAGKPMCISLFDDEVLAELCELLGIEEHSKAVL